MGIGRIVLAASLISTMLGPIGCAAAEISRYSITAHLSGTGGSWDYAVIDPKSARLYLAQAGVTAVDLRTNQVTSGLVSAKASHGIAVLEDGSVAVDDSQTKVITVFEGQTGKIVSTIPTAKFNPVNGLHALDALVLEPKTGLLIAINGESGLLLLVDVKRARVAGTISAGGHPEFAVADGTGRIFMNVNRDKSSEIATVDIASRAVVKHVPLAGCEGATGLAYDDVEKLVMSVCDNGVLEVFNVKSGRVAASITVGRGADAIMFDSKRRRAFVASGDDGTLSVISVNNANDIAVVQTLTTPAGTRLGAVDIGSGRVYLPSAKFGPPKPPIPYPAVVPGTFEFLVVSPN
jgi:DNA-binding beta-propeller fold protein YncE